MGLEQIIKDQKKKQLKIASDSFSKVTGYINQAYSSSDKDQIILAEEKIKAWCKYVQKEFGVYLPTKQQTEARLKQQKEILLEALEDYNLNQIFPKVELLKKLRKLGLNLTMRQLSAYTNTKIKYPFLEIVDKDHYKRIKPVTQNQTPQVDTLKLEEKLEEEVM